jgi:hypothetical protein
MSEPGLIQFFKLLSFILASWLLIHFFGLLGVFVALSYPLWWFLMPQKTVCLLCQVRPAGTNCPFCRQPIDKSATYPKSFSSVILNSLLLLLLTFFSVVAIYVEVAFLRIIYPEAAGKTVSFVVESKGEYYVGDFFPLKIDIAGIKTPVNVVRADLSYDRDVIQVKDISVNDSFADIFVQKEINNDIGFARLSGGLPNPGFSEEHGLFGTVFFEAVSPGVSKVEFLPSSLVLANDGLGTNVLKDFAVATYLILPREEYIPTDPSVEGTIIIKPDVLSAQTDNTKIILYDESEILGFDVSATPRAPLQVEKITITKRIAKSLLVIDLTILDAWDKVFQNVRGLFKSSL